MSQSSWHWKANITKKGFQTLLKGNVAILMTLEGEYYLGLWGIDGRRVPSQSSWHWKANITFFFLWRNKGISLSQSSWHWKANITQKILNSGRLCHVAILMTLEGEYYLLLNFSFNFSKYCRNPHDIGRRILLLNKCVHIREQRVAILMTLEGEYYKQWGKELWQNPLVAILMTLEGEYYAVCTNTGDHRGVVAILMTLEGEYYRQRSLGLYTVGESRNPHDIGRRILRKRTNCKPNFSACRNPHDIGRRILLVGFQGQNFPLSRNPHDIGRRILHFYCRLTLY